MQRDTLVSLALCIQVVGIAAQFAGSCGCCEYFGIKAVPCGSGLLLEFATAVVVVPEL